MSPASVLNGSPPHPVEHLATLPVGDLGHLLDPRPVCRVDGVPQIDEGLPLPTRTVITPAQNHDLTRLQRITIGGPATQRHHPTQRQRRTGHHTQGHAGPRRARHMADHGSLLSQCRRARATPHR